MYDNLTDICDDDSGSISARVVLGVMAFFGFMVTQMIRANLYISIVGMTNLFVSNATNYDQNIDASNMQNTLTEDILPDEKSSDWNEGYKGILFSAFYWCYWLTELPGGIMAQKWGGRKVLMYSVIIAGALNAIIPVASKYHILLLAGVRAIQGLALGVTWPAVHYLAGCWIPANERSKFMTSYHGAAIGNAITYPLCGFLMEKFNWESTFYVIAGLNILWSLGCWLFIYDSPFKHPRISVFEKNYLNHQILAKKKIDKKDSKIPWLKICSSTACWAVFFASQGVMWCSITLSMQIPTFFKNILNFGSLTNGILSGAPEFCKFGFGLFFSTLMDHILKKNWMTLTTVRKVSVATCELIPAVLLIIFCLIDASKNAVTAVVILILTTTFGGASSSGSLANIVDISPRYAGIILGLIKTLSLIPGILSPLVTEFLISEKNAESGWNYVFGLTASIHIVCCGIFLAFGSAVVQPWNDNDSLIEDVPLKSSKKEEEIRDNVKDDIPENDCEETKMR